MVRRALAVLLSILASGCSTHWRAAFAQPKDYAQLRDEPFLKAHMADGSVYVLQKWRVSTAERTLGGDGLHYDANRSKGVEGSWTLPFDEVALVETNQPETVTDTGLILLGVVTGVSLVLSAVCLTNRKACFGSCPTFYSRPDGPILAEGFSSSIARTLEATDIDALPIELGAAGPTVSLWMKNEALETHVVRSVRLLAVPLGEGGRVVRASDGYFNLQALSGPTTCRAQGQDCTAKVSSAGDEAELRSETTGTDLGAPETVELEFANHPEGRLGVVLRARTSLVETYAFYQLMAYLGRRADDWFLQLERMGAKGKELVEAVGGVLGRIDVEVQTRAGWKSAGAFQEVGPLAFDELVLPIAAELPAGPVRVRLTLAQGAWKIDQVALASLGPAVKAVPVELTAVSRRDQLLPQVTRALLSRSAPLVTYPGDLYRMDFQLPPGKHQLFLESRGYYYEWQREDWLAEESAELFVDAVWNPGAYLKRIAPAYKRLEPAIEDLFWNSRVEAK